MAQKTARRAIRLFYSYSHKDAKLRDSLAAHLAILRRQRVISEWHDRKIPPGDEWEDQIDANLDRADLILLLVSSDFVASDYCWGREMKRALQRNRRGEARVVPVIIRPVNWGGAPFAKLQALPTGAKPVTVWSNRDSAWLNVAKGIGELAAELSRTGAKAVSRPVAAKRRPSRAAAGALSLAPRVGGAPLRVIYTAGNREDLPGKIARREGDPPSGDAAVDETYDALGLTYRFFWDVFGRDSIDGKGMTLSATVHFGKNYDNSYWSGKQLVVGDGDGTIFNRFSASVDVCAHGLMHGLVQAESRLNYWDQAGALIESLSDVFASLVKQYGLGQTADTADWLIGAELLAPGIKGKALRSLAAPGSAYDNATLGKDPQPSHMRDYVKTKEDYSGAHLNMGIPNHAFYLVAKALGGPAWEKAGLIWYKALCDRRLKANARFAEFAYLTLQIAQAQFGTHSAEARAVRHGWTKVGVSTTA